MGLRNFGVAKLPGSVSGARWHRPNSFSKIFLALLIVVGIAFFYIHHHKHVIKLSNTGVVNADDSIIADYKNSANLDNKRTLISAYTEKGDYAAALSAARQVANATKTHQDYMAILTICALHSVSSKDTCINDVVAKLKPLIPDMPFNTAYGAGGMLEKNNHKKDAADFYQRALDVYDATAGGENLMSKDQLTNHINELRK